MLSYSKRLGFTGVGLNEAGSWGKQGFIVVNRLANSDFEAVEIMRAHRQA